MKHLLILLTVITLYEPLGAGGLRPIKYLEVVDYDISKPPVIKFITSNQHEIIFNGFWKVEQLQERK